MPKKIKEYIYITTHAWSRMHERTKYSDNKIIKCVYEAWQSNLRSKFLEKIENKYKKDGFQTYIYKLYYDLVFVFQKREDICLITVIKENEPK